MTVARSSSPSAEAPALRYRDLDKAVVWLCAAFDLKVISSVKGRDGHLDTAELSFGNQTVLLGSSRNDKAGELAVNADGVSRFESQSCYVLVDDIEALRAKANKARVNIVYEREADEFSGRSFSCKDLEDHIWFFGNSTSGASQKQARRGAVARHLASLTSGLLIFALGLVGWLHHNSDSSDVRKTVVVSEETKQKRPEASKGAAELQQSAQKTPEAAGLESDDDEHVAGPQPVAVNPAEATVLRGESPLGGGAGSLSSTGDADTGLVTPDLPALEPTAPTELVRRPLKLEPDEAAKESQLQSRPQGAKPTTAMRIQSEAPALLEKPAPAVRRENSKAIENARRLAEKLRKHLANSRPAGTKQPPAEAGRSADDRSAEPVDVLRRAFIVNW